MFVCILQYVQACVCAHTCLVFCEHVGICMVVHVCVLMGYLYVMCNMWCVCVCAMCVCLCVHVCLCVLLLCSFLDVWVFCLSIPLPFTVSVSQAALEWWSCSLIDHLLHACLHHAISLIDMQIPHFTCSQAILGSEQPES